jgi:hypothetical protein
VLGVSAQYVLWRAGLAHPRIFSTAAELRLRPAVDAAAG